MALLHMFDNPRLSFVFAEYKSISSLYFMVKYRERFIVRDSMRKVMLIHNSVAGMEKRFIRQREDILTYLSKYFDAIEIKSEEELSTDCARRACREGFDSVVAIGGDGTLDAVVAGMAEEEFRPKLCFLPGGTFNLICRMMGLPMNLKRALHRGGRDDDQLFTNAAATKSYLYGEDYSDRKSVV